MRVRNKASVRTLLMCLTISLLTFSTYALLARRGALSYPELKAYDALVNLMPADLRQSGNIAVVAIDEADIKYLKEVRHAYYPPNDQELATGLKAILAQQPRVVGVDLFHDMSLPSLQNPGASSDELNQLLATQPIKVVARLSTPEHEADAVGPPPIYLQPDVPPEARMDGIGAANVPTDPDGSCRRGIVLLRDPISEQKHIKPDTYFSISMLLAMDFLGESATPQFDPQQQTMTFGKARVSRIRMGDGPYVQVAPDGFEYLLDFRGGDQAGYFQTFSLRDLLEDRIPPHALKDKIVLLGVTALSVQDRLTTPVRKNHDGVQLQAQMIDQLLRMYRFGDQATAPLRAWPAWMLDLFWALAGGALGAWLRGPGKFLVGVLSGLILIAASTYLSFRHHLWLPVVAPSLAWFTAASFTVSYMAYRERAQRTLLKTLFDRHVDRKVADKVWDSRDELIENGKIKNERVTATVLFTDMVGFSAATERLQPDQLIEWLNDYMSMMSQIVLKHDGMVNKYIGDAIMAVFGVPLSSGSIARDAGNAVRCALEMRRQIAAFNQKWKQIQNIAMRVGIATGELFTGSLGSRQRLEYTVIGDIVNIASRLESVAKEIMDPDIAASGCRILVLESTWKLTGTEFVGRKMPHLHLHNIPRQVEIYGVIGQRSDGAVEPIDPADTPALPAGIKGEGSHVSLIQEPQ